MAENNFESAWFRIKTLLEQAELADTLESLQGVLISTNDPKIPINKHRAIALIKLHASLEKVINLAKNRGVPND